MRGDIVRILQMRKNIGVQQKEAAQKLRIAQNTLCQYETGARKVPVALLPKLARLYGCSIEDLFEPEELQSGSEGK